MDQNIALNLRVLAIVPAYNEEITIQPVIQEIVDKVPGIVVCVVNDGSNDKTVEKAKDSGAVVISHPFNMGIGAAVQTGFIYAIRNNFDIAVQVDGDGQHDPLFITKMVSDLKQMNADVVSGSRFIKKGGYKSSFLRRVGILIFEVINRLVVGQKITDSTSGFRAFNQRAIAFLADKYPEDYPEPEVLIILKKNGYKVIEIPVEMRSRQGGQSSIKGYKSLHYMVKVILAILMQSVKREAK
jgi:glycosyltransferase involved in cell wall biosynthesis